MTVAIGFAALVLLLVAAARVRDPHSDTAISQKQRERKLQAMMRAQDERYFGSWWL